MDASLKKQMRELLKKKNVVAVGMGHKRKDGALLSSHGVPYKAIVCSVIKKVPESELAKKDIVPKSIQGILTDVIETGVIKALQGRTGRWRPAPGGVSIGHYRITAGTLGCLVAKKGIEYILSNNHVLAESNNGAIGDEILQPGKYDGGQTFVDKLGSLAEYVKIEWIGGEACKIANAVAGTLNITASTFGRKSRLYAQTDEIPENLVDAALAKPLVNAAMPDILEIGRVNDINLSPKLGLPVQKSGRTTAVTKGNIEQTDVMTQVQYDSRIALYVDQIMIIPAGFSAPGDSGSLVLDESRNAVGLLFAGSDQVTIINRIGHIIELLEIDRIV